MLVTFWTSQMDAFRNYKKSKLSLTVTYWFYKGGLKYLWSKDTVDLLGQIWSSALGLIANFVMIT